MTGVPEVLNLGCFIIQLLFSYLLAVLGAARDLRHLLNSKLLGEQMPSDSLQYFMLERLSYVVAITSLKPFLSKGSAQPSIT
jgi:hypothetical protein